ncbi:serine-rich adhesin for platelets-like [Latimeria chalumnae]|uniref:serine-rich adhesin for platelets-like n=1 Tax=Latimeria chalumnae TaxID=7897 RepID=UPI0006D938EA|nr:PREDICTED: serine-rich adhesin for platelets-like isoform X2 [Latimeria chalumnae]|eukprot:XP_014347734.1 PREDICTED: serine-rich adhesin for platelets-like isoform X2 [Latimeria chalumnae]
MCSASGNRLYNLLMEEDSPQYQGFRAQPQPQGYQQIWVDSTDTYSEFHMGHTILPSVTTQRQKNTTRHLHQPFSTEGPQSLTLYNYRTVVVSDPVSKPVEDDNCNLLAQAMLVSGIPTLLGNVVVQINPAADQQDGIAHSNSIASNHQQRSKDFEVTNQASFQMDASESEAEEVESSLSPSSFGKAPAAENSESLILIHPSCLKQKLSGDQSPSTIRFDSPVEPSTSEHRILLNVGHSSPPLRTSQLPVLATAKRSLTLASSSVENVVHGSESAVSTEKQSQSIDPYSLPEKVPSDPSILSTTLSVCSKHKSSPENMLLSLDTLSTTLSVYSRLTSSNEDTPSSPETLATTLSVSSRPTSSSSTSDEDCTSQCSCCPGAVEEDSTEYPDSSAGEDSASQESLSALNSDILKLSPQEKLPFPGKEEILIEDDPNCTKSTTIPSKQSPSTRYKSKSSPALSVESSQDHFYTPCSSPGEGQIHADSYQCEQDQAVSELLGIKDLEAPESRCGSPPPEANTFLEEQNPLFYLPLETEESIEQMTNSKTTNDPTPGNKSPLTDHQSLFIAGSSTDAMEWPSKKRVWDQAKNEWSRMKVRKKVEQSCSGEHSAKTEINLLREQEEKPTKQLRSSCKKKVGTSNKAGAASKVYDDMHKDLYVKAILFRKFMKCKNWSPKKGNK